MMAVCLRRFCLHMNVVVVQNTHNHYREYTHEVHKTLSNEPLWRHDYRDEK